MGKFAFGVLTEMEMKLPFYLVGVGIDFHQEMDPHDRPKGYPYYQWIQCEEGEGQLYLGEKEHLVGPNQAMFLYPDVPHRYFPVTSPWKVHWFTFGGAEMPTVLQTIGLGMSGVYSIVHGEQLVGKMRIALHHLLSNSALKGVECSSMVYDFLIALMKYVHLSNSEAVVTKYSRLEPVFRFIEGHFAETITIDDLAEIVDVSPQHLCHLFKETMGHRPFEYVNSFRIARSKDFMVTEPDLSLSEIARKSGYESLSYFSSVFRKLEGISPGEYRRIYLGRV